VLCADANGLVATRQPALCPFNSRNGLAIDSANLRFLAFVLEFIVFRANFYKKYLFIFSSKCNEVQFVRHCQAILLLNSVEPLGHQGYLFSTVSCKAADCIANNS
jgi:hypothetical protein